MPNGRSSSKLWDYIPESLTDQQLVHWLTVSSAGPPPHLQPYCLAATASQDGKTGNGRARTGAAESACRGNKQARVCIRLSTSSINPHLLDLEVLNRDRYLFLKSRSIFSILFLSSFFFAYFLLFSLLHRVEPSFAHGEHPPPSFHLSQASFFCLHKLGSVESLYHVSLLAYAEAK